MVLDIENEFLKPGHFGVFPIMVGDVPYDVYFQVRRNKFVVATDFSMGSITAGSSTGSGVKEIKDGDIYILESPQEKVINHGFIGIHPSDAWLYEEYPQGETTRKIKSLTRVGANYGYITGWQSMYLNPSKLTEWVTIYDLKPPVYTMYSPHNNITGYLNFYFMKYWVDYINDPKLLESFETKTRKCTPLTLGDVEKPPIAPSWLARFLRERDEGRR